MVKLNINYRIKDNERDYYKGQTYYSISLESRITTISICPNEKRKLKEIVDGIIEELKFRTYLKEDELVEIENFEKEIMNFEETNNERVNNKMHNILKLLYPHLENGNINTVEEARKYLDNKEFV